MGGKTGSNEKIKPNERLNHNKNLKHISSFSVCIESANIFLVYDFYFMIVYFTHLLTYKWWVLLSLQIYDEKHDRVLWMYLCTAYQDKAATDKLSAVKWLEKELENTIHLFEDRNVSELKTNGNNLLFEKCAVIFMDIHFRNEGHKTFR